MDEEAVRQIVRRVVLKALQAETLEPETSASTPSLESLDSSPEANFSTARVVALGADHGGFALKEVLRGYLRELGYSITDCGTHSSDPVDYPDIALEVAKMVAEGQAWRGIIVDGAGIGSAIAANKIPGIRASLCYDVSTARNAREHNDANILTLGGRLIGEELAKQIVKTFLETEFGGGRHSRRVEKISQIEKQFLGNLQPMSS